MKSQKLYRVYRYNPDDAFEAPRGWLKYDAATSGTSWKPADAATLFSLAEAELLTEDWNDFYASKGQALRAAFEPE